MAFASLISVFMPVPIALDVMFAAQLHQQGVASGYVMLFAMTLGTYSIIPSIYLWREVSKPLAASLFVFFLGVGWLLGIVSSGVAVLGPLVALSILVACGKGNVDCCWSACTAAQRFSVFFSAMLAPCL